MMVQLGKHAGNMQSVKILEWSASLTIRDILERGVLPEDRALVYAVSSEKVLIKNNVLYVGQSGMKNEFRPKVRIGSLIICALGFYNQENNKKHKGGEEIHKYCTENKINPLDLYLFWSYSNDCSNDEKELIKQLTPKYNY